MFSLIWPFHKPRPSQWLSPHMHTFQFLQRHIDCSLMLSVGGPWWTEGSLQVNPVCPCLMADYRQVGFRPLSCLLRFIPPAVWSWECKLVYIYLHFPRCLSSLLMQHDAACWSVKDHKNQVYLGGSDVDPNRHPALVDLTCFIWYWIRLYGINGDCWAFAEVCTLMRVILILNVIFRA